MIEELPMGRWLFGSLSGALVLAAAAAGVIFAVSSLLLASLAVGLLVLALAVGLGGSGSRWVSRSSRYGSGGASGSW
jgi:hypothetical protein